MIDNSFSFMSIQIMEDILVTAFVSAILWAAIAFVGAGLMKLKSKLRSGGEVTATKWNLTLLAVVATTVLVGWLIGELDTWAYFKYGVEVNSTVMLFGIATACAWLAYKGVLHIDREADQ